VPGKWAGVLVRNFCGGEKSEEARGNENPRKKKRNKYTRHRIKEGISNRRLGKKGSWGGFAFGWRLSRPFRQMLGKGE